MFALQPEREFDLLQFPLQRALLRQEQILGELLGQRRAALRNAAMQHVRHRRAQDAPGIDAVMRIEPAVFDGDEGLRQVGRQVLQRNIGAGHFAAGRQHAAVEARDLDRSAAASEFQAPGSAADARRPRPRRRRSRSPPTGRAPRPNRTGGTARRARRLADLRLRLTRAAFGLRSGGASRHRRPARLVLRLADDFFGFSSSADVTRSCGPRRNSASDAPSPNCGSLRPPLFCRPHAIRQRPHRSRAYSAKCTGFGTEYAPLTQRSVLAAADFAGNARRDASGRGLKPS